MTSDVWEASESVESAESGEAAGSSGTGSSGEASGSPGNGPPEKPSRSLGKRPPEKPLISPGIKASENPLGLPGASAFPTGRPVAAGRKIEMGSRKGEHRAVDVYRMHPTMRAVIIFCLGGALALADPLVEGVLLHFWIAYLILFFLCFGVERGGGGTVEPAEGLGRPAAPALCGPWHYPGRDYRAPPADGPSRCESGWIRPITFMPKRGRNRSGSGGGSIAGPSRFARIAGAWSGLRRRGWPSKAP